MKRLSRGLQFDERLRVHYGFGDGLRALAILLIVLFHAHVEIVPQLRFHRINLFVPLLDDLGRLPVAMFFVLSGFLLSRPFLGALLDARTLPSFGHFWLARVLRIYPLYAFAVIAVAIVDVLCMHQSLSAADLLTHLTFTHTLFEATAETIAGPFWTMAIDAQFYLLLPFLAAAAAAFTRRMSVAGRIEFIAAASLGILFLNAVVRFLLLLSVRVPVSTSLEKVLIKNIWGVLGMFLLGALVQLWTMFAGNVSSDERHRLARRAFTAGALVLAFHIVGTVLHLHGAAGYVTFRDKLWGAVEDPIAGLGCALLVLGFSAHPEALVARALSSPPAVAFAVLSYAMYLFHSTVLKAMSPLFGSLPANAGFLVLFVSGLMVVLPIAYATHHTIELPFLRIKEKLRRGVPTSRATAVDLR